MNIRLTIMTKELARQYFQGFVVDPALFMDNQEYKPYIYKEEQADDIVDRYRQMGRIYLAVMYHDEPIGEIVFKNIERQSKHCTLGISLQSDKFKNKGLGTKAEIMAIHSHISDATRATGVFWIRRSSNNLIFMPIISYSYS